MKLPLKYLPEIIANSPRFKSVCELIDGGWKPIPGKEKSFEFQKRVNGKTCAKTISMDGEISDIEPTITSQVERKKRYKELHSRKISK